MTVYICLNFINLNSSPDCCSDACRSIEAGGSAIGISAGAAGDDWPFNLASVSIDSNEDKKRVLKLRVWILIHFKENFLDKNSCKIYQD